MALEVGKRGKGERRPMGRQRLVAAMLLLMVAAGALVLHFRPPRIMRPLRILRAKAAAVAREIAAARDPRTARLLAAMPEARSNEGAAARDELMAMGKPVVPLLIRRLKDPDAPTRAAAALVLGRIGDARAVAPLCRVLGDPEETVRFRAVYALGTLKDRTAVPQIAPLLTDPSPDVVQTTIRTLEECHCKVHPRDPLPGYKIRPWGDEEWQEIVPEEQAPETPAEGSGGS